jgi:hypothetical protein
VTAICVLLYSYFRPHNYAATDADCKQNRSIDTPVGCSCLQPSAQSHMW